MCVNYKISQNSPKMLELAVDHFAAFSEILDDFKFLASLKWNEILWVIFEVETKLNGFWGPRTILRSILKCPIFVYYTLWNLQCAGLVWCSLRLSILGTGQLCTSTVAQCPRCALAQWPSAEGPSVQDTQSQAAPHKCTSRGAQCPSAQAHGPDTTCAQCPRNVQRQSPTKCTGRVAAPVQDRVWQPLATAPAPAPH